MKEKKSGKNSQILLRLDINKNGISVIFTIVILSLLFIFTTGMLFLFKLWEKTANKILAGKEAYRFTKTGIEEAIWEIDHDSKEYDCFYDNWRKNFKGNEVDVNEDEIPDAKWIYVYDRNKKIVGRYCVLVEDESGKININRCGNLKGKFNEGYTPGEINILANLIGWENSIEIVKFRYGEDGKPGKSFFDDDKDYSTDISDGIDNDGDGYVDESDEGIDENDEFDFKNPKNDDRPYFSISDVKLVKGIGKENYDKIKNFITIFSYDLNKNRYGEERININSANFKTLSSLFKKLGYSEKQSAQISLNIIDYRDKDCIPTTKIINGEKLFGVEKTPYLNEIEAFVPWEKEVLPSGTVIWWEKKGQFIEIFNPYPEEIDISGWRITGVITLFSNFWNEVFTESKEIYDDVINGETEIDKKKADSILQKLIPTSITIKNGAKIPPFSFYTIGDRIRIMIIIPTEGPPVILFLPASDPSNSDQFEPILAINPGSLGPISSFLSSIPFLSNLGLDFTVSLFDENGNLIEKATYPPDTPFTTVQKNDPRMRGENGWFPGLPTPGKLNSVFAPWIGGEFGKMGWVLLWKSSFNIKNNSFSSLGELSLIHRGQQWKTVDFWKGGKDRKIIDYFTTSKNPSIPEYGRLNINTATETTLSCLPLVDREVAKSITKARPFKDISEILGIHGENSPKGLLNKEITKYGFDFMDNDHDNIPDTEKEKEMIFYKIINLITVRSNVFQIISIGEKVQDKNNNGKIEENEVIAKKKISVWYDRNKKKVIYRREL